jgi:exonuclease SbcD
MRFVHTSDWHLGRTFGGQSLHAQQEAFISWLVDLVRDEQASLVVVAGDVYDRSIPAAETVALFGSALRALRGAGAEVVVIAGNHDSAERLGAYDDLTDLAGVYIRGGYRRAGTVLRLQATDGPVDVVAVPFLEPALAPAAPVADDVAAGGRDGDAAVEAAVDTDPVERATHRLVLQRAIDTARAALSAPRSIAVAHAFVAGATSSESERTLSVGGSALVPAAVFDGFSYAALGHLHKPQAFSDTVRYSGSPLHYSFSEQHAKQVLVVDLDRSGAASVRPVVVEPGRRVATVRGRLDEVLADSRHAGAEACWVRAVLTDPTYVIDAKARLQRRFPHVVEVVLDPVRPATDRGADTGSARRGGHSPLHHAVGFWHAVTGEPTPHHVAELLAAALDDARVALGDAGRGWQVGSVAEAMADGRAPTAASTPDGRPVETGGAQPSPDELPLDGAPAAVVHEAAPAGASRPPVSSRRRRAPDAAETPSLFDDDAWGHAS